jgi:amidophosphoribosyltransferase
MSEQIKHECGVAFVRLLKPLPYYTEKYGTPLYGLYKLCLMMEKQHNRGHDGAGIAGIKFDMAPGSKYISIERSVSGDPIRDIFSRVTREINDLCGGKAPGSCDLDWLKERARFCGELYLGHLRYGTYGKNSLEFCHPFLRESNWMSKSLVVAGNFNMTNSDELFRILIDIGQHPKNRSDTVTILEKIGHFLDEENELVYQKHKAAGFSKREISASIARDINILSCLRQACKKWDGGYVIAGLIGHGDAFILRDPCGIRPAFYYQDDEVVAAASERPVIQTAFNAPFEAVREVKPGHALIIKKDGKTGEYEFTSPRKRRACSFERIYFSRGSDAEIYQERKLLGKHLAAPVMKAIDSDLKNTVFSFIPNTAETCYFGMMQELRKICREAQVKKILALRRGVTADKLRSIIDWYPRVEKIALKDVKLRTFITEDAQRGELVAHVYDVTYGSIRPGKDGIVIIDDSIVRGTTLKDSILKMLDRLGPVSITLVSSAPQIRYPDCYGIDMAKLGDFIAFQAAVALLKETGRAYVLDEVYKEAKAQNSVPLKKLPNYVRAVYKPFTAEEISAKIADLVSPPGLKAKFQIIFQTIEDLQKSCPRNNGDWYFTGNYPTPGGNRVVNQSFINYYEGRNERAY